MEIYLWSVLAMLVGLLMYALCANPKLQEIGRLSYFAGILAFLLKFASTLHIGTS